MQSDLKRVIEREFETQDAAHADFMAKFCLLSWLVIGGAFIWIVPGISIASMIGVFAISISSALFAFALKELEVWEGLEEIEDGDVEAAAKQAYARGEITREEMEERIEHAVRDEDDCELDLVRN